MTFEPLPTNMKSSVMQDQFSPKLAVLQLRPAPIPPSLALPPENVCAHSINQVFGV
jgi:hypothetical protein